MAPPPSGPSRFVVTGQFGVDDVRWQVSPEDKPADVAAAVLHHLLVRRLRELYAGRLTADGLAAATGGSERTTLRLLNGEGDASLANVVAWTAAAGPALVEHLTFDPLSLLPTEAPPPVQDWQPGQWRPLRFSVGAGPLDIDWRRVATGIAGYLSTEEAHGRARLITVEVIRHLTLTAVTEAGVPAGLLSIDAPVDDGGDIVDLVVDAEPETMAISFACAFGTGSGRDALRAATSSIITVMRKAAVAHADHRTVLVVASEAVADRLARVWRGCTGAPGDPLVLDFGDIRNYVGTGAEPFDVRGRLLARPATTSFFVAVAELDKPDAPLSRVAPA